METNGIKGIRHQAYRALRRDRLRKALYALAVPALLVLISACSVKSNTRLSRFYHGMATRYNILYNGQKTYDEAYDGLLTGLNESYSQRIPTDPIAYQIAPDKKPGGALDKSVEKAQKAIRLHSIRTKPERRAGWRRDPKAVAEQQRSEYNPAMHRAWLLLGQSHFYNADLDEALSTFAYMSRLYATEQAVRDRALLWQLRTLSLLERPSEGQQILSQLDTTSVERIHAVREVYYLALAEHFLSLGQDERALPYLEQAIPYAEGSIQRARLYYLLGQVCSSSPANASRAYEAYSRTLKLSPPPALDFAARIRRTELLPSGTQSIIRELRSMARRSKYRDQLDQIYYAIGRSELSAGDTIAAMASFRFAADTSRLRREDYALNLLALGRLYLARHEWLPAQRAYSSAMSALPETHPEHHGARIIATGLDSLAPSARIVYEGDSILHLIALPEGERLRVIDSVITALKRREAEEARQRARDSIAQANQALQAGMPQPAGITPATPPMPQTDRRFYFYNPQLLEQGRQAFERAWGRRTLEDDWRRRRRTMGATPSGALDSLAKGVDPLTGQALDVPSDTPATPESEDPHQRAYYLAQLPTSPEAQQTLHSSIEGGLADMGRSLGEHLDLLSEAAEQWERQLARYPDGERYEQSLYDLHMMRLRLGQTAEAERLRLQYVARYGNTPRGRELSTPGYLDRLRSRDANLQRLYTEAYESYMHGRTASVERILTEVQTHYPTSDLLPRLLFLSALGKASEGDTEAFRTRLSELSLLPTATQDINTLAQAMLAGLAEGRRLSGSTLGSIDWRIATGAIAMTGEVADITFDPPKASDRYALLVLMPVADMTQSQLMFALTAYGFTEHTQESLTVTPLPSTAYQLVSITDFSSLASMGAFARGLKDYGQGAFSAAHVVPISMSNLARISSQEAMGAYLLYLATSQPRLPLAYTTPEVETLPEEQITADVPTSDTVAPSAPIDFAIDRSTLLEADTTDREAEEEEIQIPREASLHHTHLSYDEVQASADERIRTQQEDRKTAEKERKAELKARAKEREALRRAKEKEQKERLRQRDRERKAREAEQRRLAKERAKAQREAQRAREASRRAHS